MTVHSAPHTAAAAAGSQASRIKYHCINTHFSPVAAVQSPMAGHSFIVFGYRLALFITAYRTANLIRFSGYRFTSLITLGLLANFSRSWQNVPIIHDTS